jgi:ADP-heptose:LPS heptosyltransferase
MRQKLDAVNKIAVLRANALGDFVFALPALTALRAAYPAAEIVYLGQPWHAAFLNGRPGPWDRAIAVPHSQGVYDEPGVEEEPAELERFFAAMQAERFDLAIQMHGGGRYSNPFVRRLEARLAVGTQASDADPLDRTVPYIYWQNEILRWLEVVALAGAGVVGLEPRLAVTQRDLDESRAAVPDGDRPLVTLHPGSGDPRRRWPAARFAAVGDALAASGADVLVTGSGFEDYLARAILDEMAAPGQDTTGQLEMGGLAGLLSRCALVVSNDSGPLHLAGAVGTATVGIFWFGNLITAGWPTRARHRAAISWRTECPVCGVNYLRSHCQHEVSHVADVGVEEVRDAALELLVQSL